MTFDDIKIWCINSGVLAISFTEVEMLLKIFLLSTTIVYTVQKIIVNGRAGDK
jgi:hypothetical protein